MQYHQVLTVLYLLKIVYLIRSRFLVTDEVDI